MKTKHLLLSLAIMLCATSLTRAADVDLSTAQSAARAFLNRQVANGRLKAPAATNLQLVKAEASVAKPTAVDYYIFNADESYVVIAGDDQAPQILMYGEEGKLDMNNIPPAMQWLLNKYKYQIDGIKAGTMVPVKAPKFATTAVEPLVTANWDQSAPYNNQCPTSGGSRALTGCPATSLAMCYYKWKWPDTYPAVAAISSENGIPASALPEREADWDNIIDEYTGPTNYTSTPAQKDAVAWLMRYAGQAIPDYSYGIGASGANDPEIYQGCLNMGYTDAQYLLLTELVSSGWGYTNGPQQYTDAQWNEYMLNELHNGRPIEYLAYDVSYGYSVSGHAFNVFGCDTEGKYYVNWGWSGDSNGYCTLHNFTTATGATGQSGSYVFNYGEAMIIGIEPPAGALTNPRIKANPSMLTMGTTVGMPTTATFTVTGYNLTDDVTLSLSGDDAFAISTGSITLSQALEGTTVTVTYDPAAIGTHEATITLTSNEAQTVTVKLNGTAEPTPLETYAPVLLDASNINSTSFTAIWTDQTPAENVASYTLYVSDKPFKPAVALLDSIDWSMSNAIPTGWTQQGLNYYSYNSACYLSASANGYVKSKTYDLDGYDKLTVMVYAEPYNSGNTITVTTSAGSKTVNLPSGGSFAWYTLVVDCASSDYMKLTSTGMPDMRYLKVYAGDPTSTQHTVTETGDATQRVITGITDKRYTVNGLTSGGTFYFYVVANYTNSTLDHSATKEVTLADTPAPVMQPANESNISNTSFRADWTDDNPAENVASYTLWVKQHSESSLLLEETFAKCTKHGSQDIGSDMDNYMDNAGWTGTKVFQEAGGVRLGSSSAKGNITSPALDLTDGTGKITIIFNAKPYSNDKNIGVKIACGDVSQDITVTAEGQQTIVLDAVQAANQKVQIATIANGKRIIITSLKIIDGEVTAGNNAPRRVATEQGDASTRTITGITDKFYLVKELTPGGTFDYKVKAIYADGSESSWSNIMQVILHDQPQTGIRGDIDLDGVVDVNDVNILISILLGRENAADYGTRYDLNNNGMADIDDINTLINIILGKETASRTAHKPTLQPNRIAGTDAAK